MAINLSKRGDVGITDVTVLALFRFFREEAKVSAAQALEAAEAVVRLQSEGRLDEVLAIAREGKE